VFLISDLHIVVGDGIGLLCGRTWDRFGGPSGSLVVPILKSGFV
jgi:hypothetical protein